MSDIIAAARQEAARLGHDYIGSEHLLLALVQTGDPALGAVLAAFSIAPDALKERIEKRAPRGRGAPPDLASMPIRSGARRAMDAASALAGGTEPGSRHLLAALLGDGKGIVPTSLNDLGAPVAKVREALGAGPPAPGERSAPAAAPELKPAQGRERKGRERGQKEPAGRPQEPQRPRTAASAPPPTPREEPGAPPRIPPVHDPFLTWRKLPLLAIPLSLYFAFVAHASPLVVFTTACLAVLPLAGYMGEATEHLSARTGPTLGGFLNATFGNAAELIIAIVALRAGLVELVKASIVGSILGNLLLILGLSIVVGGMGRPTVRFSRTAAGMSAGMLALAVTGLIFPTLFHATHTGAAAVVRELRFSEAVAVVLILTYGFSLLFSLRTHSRLLGGEPHPVTARTWGVGFSMAVLALATVGVAIESEILVHAVEGITRDSAWLTQGFLGLIVIPLIGNAAEHATAVVVAKKGKMDLALQIALGSSTQIALLIAPLLVFIGLVTVPASSGVQMDLVFQPMAVLGLGLATLLASIVTLDGESNWFEGVQLLALYALVAIAVFFL
ncbi:MAG: calcium/proton exchanger [Gemmatimonadota bacterium]|nr:calcium/proton exchanger [Gemmatimonadota bacterium]